MSVNKPMLTAMHESIAEAYAAAQSGDAGTAIYGLLDAFNAMARHLAQVSWTLLHNDPDRDEHMEEAEDDLVFSVLKMPIIRKLYPEFRAQAENVIRDAFQDEHLRLEDPLDWEEMNRDPSSSNQESRS